MHESAPPYVHVFYIILYILWYAGACDCTDYPSMQCCSVWNSRSMRLTIITVKCNTIIIVIKIIIIIQL